MANELKGVVEKIQRDEQGEAWGLKLRTGSGSMNLKYSKLENRNLPWDAHKEGNVVKVLYNPSEWNGKITNWVSSIERQDSDTPEGPVTAEDTPEVKERKAQAVREVLNDEHYRDRAISRQVALKCAAEVVVAALPYVVLIDAGIEGAPDTPVLRTSSLASLIDTCIERFKLGLDE